MTVSSSTQTCSSGRPRCRRHLAATMVGFTALAMVAASCGAEDGGTDADDQGGDGNQGLATVVVTTDIWADVVANVACHDLVEIETLIPAGADPHSFEPSLRDRAAIDDAALIVSNGLDLEEGLVDTLATVVDDGAALFEVAAHVDTIDFDLGDGGHTDDHGHQDDEHDDEAENDGDGDGHDGADPHIWFDPVRVASALPALAQHLVDQTGLDPAMVESCAADYQSELAAVDAEIAELVAPLPEPQRKLVTGHGSLGYFADRYGFEVVGTVIPATSSMAAANPAQLEELAELMEREGIVAVFTDAQEATDDAEALADRLDGVTVVPLLTGSLGDPDNTDATYVGFLRNNARSIVDGLS